MDDVARDRTARVIAEALLDSVDEAALTAIRELARVNEHLKAAGIEHPTGARGVEDLAGLYESAERETKTLTAFLLAQGYPADVIDAVKDEGS